MVRITKKIIFLLIVILCAVFLLCFYLFFSQNKKTENLFFFERDTTNVEYEGFFYPLSCREIQQNINLNINQIGTFKEGALFTLELEQLDVCDYEDQISMGRRYLGYFYVTSDTIYRIPVSTYDGFTDEQTQEIIDLIQTDKASFLEKCDVVCNDSGTNDIVDQDGYHAYVEVDGERRIYHFYNDYTGGTKDYEQIVWEKGKGIVYYVRGAGSMLMHVEIGLELNR